MPVLQNVGWQRLVYPAWWEGQSDHNQFGGQQASPDCEYLWLWQTGARTGGLGRVALYSCASGVWKYGTFPGACQPAGFAIPTTVPGVTDQVGTFFDMLTEQINYVFFNGGSIPATHDIDGFDLYNNQTPFQIGFGTSGKLITLETEPDVVYAVYGGSLNANVNALMDFRPAARYNSIYLAGDPALSSLGIQGSTSPAAVGSNLGNNSQTTLPLRYYYQPTGLYCRGVEKERTNQIMDGAYWNADRSNLQPFPTKIYRDPPAGPAPLICDTANTPFEQTLYNLGTTNVNPYYCFDATSFVIPAISGPFLAGVSHVPFNTDQSLFGLPIAVDVPGDFVSANWSIFEMTGTTFILDDIGNFYRLVLSQVRLGFYNLNNWSRLLNLPAGA